MAVDVNCAPACAPNVPTDLPLPPATTPPVIGAITVATSCASPLHVQICDDLTSKPLTSILCDPLTGAEILLVTLVSPAGIPSTAAFVLATGVTYAGSISALVTCPDVDSESDAILMCDAGTTPFWRWIVKVNGVPNGVSFDTNFSGLPYVPVGPVTAGACAIAAVIPPQNYAFMSGILAGPTTFNLAAAITPGRALFSYTVTFLTAPGVIGAATVPEGTWSWSSEEGGDIVNRPAVISSSGDIFIQWTERN